MTEPDAAQLKMNELAEDLVRRGLDEGGDFFVSGHRRGVDLSSEYVGLRREDGRFRATYHDMGRTTVLADAPDLDTARASFLRALVNLGQGRGRRVREEDFDL
ncbi:MAG: hypothetical protein JWR42_2335 [Marmoricola sp.]|nr:hypothetical protein [Marmoricola sp.]